MEEYLKRNELSLKEYQQKGILWCKELEKNGVLLNGVCVRSGILADEMGLGKTIQMIGTMLDNFKLHTLIVLPKVLLEQWRNIIYTTLGHKPLIYHGATAKGVSLCMLYNAPIVLTTYGMLSYTKEKYIKGNPVKYNVLHEVVWDRIIFDEAHHLRNRNTHNHKAAVHIKAVHKWLVTGTPIQNGITDLYGLCAVLGISQSYFTKQDDMNTIISNLILKRTKSQVGIEMPILTHNLITVKWEHKKEREIAAGIHVQLHFNKKSDILEVDTSTNMHPFAVMHRAKQSCITMKMMPSISEVGYQSKLNKVIHMIEERKENGNAKLVFCFYHVEMDILVSSLSDKGMRVAKFDGSTRQSLRTKLLSEELDVLVLQIKTGCEGLNLQRFNEVYFVSPQWNPAVEDQAVARSHRIGQDKRVEVFSFDMEAFDDDDIKNDTMDTYIHHTQQYKRGLYLS